MSSALPSPTIWYAMCASPFFAYCVCGTTPKTIRPAAQLASSRLHRCAQATLAQDLAGGIEPRRAHHPAAGMGCGAAQIEARNRRPVARVARHRTEREELAGSHRALEDVAAREIEDAFEVRRRQHLAVEDRALEVGRVLIEEVEAAVREGVTLVVPGSVAKLVRGVLHEHRHQMAAGRRDRRGDRALEDGLCGGAPVLGVVEGALDVVLVGTDVDGAAMLGARLGARQRVEVRQ